MYEKEAAIALVEEAQQNKIRWNYATWQMKVNLIYDMRNGLNDWVDDFTDEERGDAVLTVLDSARNKEELKKIMKGLKDPLIVSRDKVYIEDFESLDINRYRLIKAKFNY